MARFTIALNGPQKPKLTRIGGFIPVPMPVDVSFMKDLLWQLNDRKDDAEVKEEGI